MYAVIGANGYLGSYIVKAILELTDEKVIATSLNIKRAKKQSRVEWRECDVQSDDSVNSLLEYLKQYSNLKMVYLAAYHHPDQVEQNKELAWDINVTSLSKFMMKAGFADKIFYASTDCVYGNSVDEHHFVETDALNPVNFYGHNKCAAEAVMVHLGRNVVRFPFLISPSIVYKPHFYDVIAESIRSGKSFEMYEDSFRSSLSFENAAKLLIELMEKDRVPQIINICGDQALSKYDIGLMIADREGVSRDLIVPISIAQPKDNFTIERAKSTLMDNTLLKSILGISKIDVFDEPI